MTKYTFENETVTYYELNYGLVENIIAEYFGVDDVEWDEIPCNGWSFNGEIKKEELSDYDKRQLEKVKEVKYRKNWTGGSDWPTVDISIWYLDIVLRELVNNDVIPSGNYLINFDW